MILDLHDALPLINKANRLKLLTTQNRIWVPQYGKTQYVNLMTIRYVRNLRRWLARRAEQLYDDYYWYCFAPPLPVSGDAAMDAVESAMAEFEELKPRKWLRQQPLYRQLLIREWRAR